MRNYGTGYPTLHNNLTIKRPSRAGKNCNLYKGGRVIVGGYIWIRDRSHPFANSGGYVAEHRLVMERHLNAILLPWIDVHHINEVKDDNRLENLVVIPHGKHSIHHNKIDMSGRKCVDCESNKTTHHHNTSCWYKTKNGFRCFICYRRNLRKRKRLNVTQ